MEDAIFNATVIRRHELTDALCIVRIRPDSGVVPPFEPGQFCTLGLPRAEPVTVGGVGGSVEAEQHVGPPRRGPRMVRRAYSIASSADEREYVELYVVLVAEGRLTPRLWTLQEGDRLWMADKCEGHFTLAHVPPEKDLVMVSTGTGIAPFVSMLRTYRGRGERRWRRFVLIHGARLACDLGYCDELRRVAEEDASVFYIPVVSREPAASTWQGVRGRVQAALEPEIYRGLVGAALTPADCHVFLCGNPQMIDDVEKQLGAQGFRTRTLDHPEGNIHFERYW